MKKIDTELESKLIKRFIVDKKQDRYLQLVQKEKTRGKLIRELAHFSSQLKDFEEIKNNEHQVVYESLRKLGTVSDCYVISDNSKLDGRRMDISTALVEIVGNGLGTLIVFGDANLVYYEGEGPSDRWISKIIK